MKTIEEPRLERDLGYRFQYLAEFMEFGPDVIGAIHAAAPAIATVPTGFSGEPPPGRAETPPKLLH